MADELGIELKDVGAALSPDQFSVPGSLLQIEVNNRHPLGYGMPEKAAVMFDESPFFPVSNGLPVAQYSGEPTLLSGWARGEKALAGQSALSEIRLDRGVAVLIGFRTQFRAQTRATFKFLFNALFYATTLHE